VAFSLRAERNSSESSLGFMVEGSGGTGGPLRHSPLHLPDGSLPIRESPSKLV